MLTWDTSAISVSDLTYRIGKNTVIEKLTFHVAVGEVFGLLGHNGAGKTTTIRLLNGLLQPEAGKMRVMGFDPGKQGHLLRRHTGVLTETPSLEEQLSARDNLRIFARIYDIPRTKIAQRVEELLHFFDLTAHANALVVIVVPLLVLMFAQAIGLFYLNLQVALVLGLVLWLIDCMLLWFGGHYFRRHRILTRL